MIRALNRKGRALGLAGLIAPVGFAICGLALLARTAKAEDPIVVTDARPNYTFTQDTRGSLHFCDLVTVVGKAPVLIKLTAAFITDDTKPKDHDLSVAYIVEAFIVGAAKGSNKIEPHQVKVLSGKIISNIFHTDLQASKNANNDLGATYNITSEGALALFTNVVSVTGKYQLAVELERDTSLVFDVKPTLEIFDAGNKWNECSIAIMEHKTKQ
jgi:hypothetical protein